MSKYHAQKTVVDGITFASKKEARRYGELKLLERAGEIADLQLQPRFELVVKGHKICTYVGDFMYSNWRNAGTDKFIATIEDVKGVKTPVYQLKKKLMKACYGIEIQEV
jgi:hypothetical protein